jgi:predicted secreted Zn-dependent protease
MKRKLRNFSVYLGLQLLFVASMANAQAIGACFGFSNCEEVKYNVTGNNKSELTQEMVSKGPGDGWGQTLSIFTGQDKWTESQTDSGQFYVSAIEIEPKITITLPAWTNYSSGSACMQGSWDRMYSSLAAHEQKHAQIATDYAKKMREAALAVSPQATSADLMTALVAALRPIANAYSAAQDQLDTSTSHGANDPVDPIIFDEC